MERRVTSTRVLLYWLCINNFLQSMYLFDNELFAIECMAKYAMEGLNVNYRGIHNGRRDQFAHCPTPSSMGDWGYYLTFNDHQHQGLLQSKDMGRRCFWVGHTKGWLNTYPPNYFELYDIFDEYVKGAHSGNLGIPRRLGIPHSEEFKKRRSLAMMGKVGALCNRSKPVLIIKPDGTKLYFAGGYEAGRALGVCPSNISLYARRGGPVRAGQFKDWEFSFTQ